MQRIDRELYEQFIIGAISNLSNRFSRFTDSLHSGITFKQWYLMMMMARMEDDAPKNVRDIAEQTGTTRQNVKKMLASLEDKGFVTSKRSSTDGRALDIDLTSKAYRYFRDEGSEVERKIDELFAPLSDADLQAVVTVIQSLVDCLDEMESAEDE